MSAHEREEPVPFWTLWQNKIDPIDLLILRELAAGTPESRIPERISLELNVAMSRPKVREKIEILERKGVLMKRDTIIANPAKLHANIYLAFIKTNLLSPIAPAPVQTWRDSFRRILKINEDFGNPIRMLFNVGGTGEYDFIALIYMNNPKEYHDFKETLVKETGLIEKFDTKYADIPELFYFDPISIPDHMEYRKCLMRYNRILNDLAKKGRNATT